MASPDALRRISLFAELGDDALARVAARTTSATVAAQHVLIDVGQPANGLFFLEDGRAVAELPDGKEIDLQPGSFFGELALLADRTRTARVRTVTESKVLAMSRADFEDLVASEPALAIGLLRNLAERVANLT
jgi:CRP-like cAMP-binding protein